MRLFIAIYPPKELIEQIFSEVTAVIGKNCRFTDKSQAHLTLLFLGDIEAAFVGALTKKVATISRTQQAFDIETLGYRYLPSEKAPRLLVLSCRLNSELAGLQHQCKSLLLSKDEDKKQFLPHITVCRFKRKPRKLMTVHHRSEKFKVSDIKLMHSELLLERAAHHCLESFKLAH